MTADTWQTAEPEARKLPGLVGGQDRNQVCAKVAAHGQMYFCSLVEIPTLDENDLEFRAFSCGDKDDTFWHARYEERLQRGKDGADVDVATWRECVERFVEYLDKEEERNDV